MRTFLIRCPKCCAERKWIPRKKYLVGLKARCFRCESVFRPYKSINDNQIIKVVR